MLALDRHAWRPGRLERLEDRLAPAGVPVLVDGLEFLPSTNFQQSGADYLLGPGAKVDIGYTPLGTENFQPLVHFDLGANAGFFSLDTTQSSDPFFNVYDVTLSIVAIKNDNGPSVPIPIWKSNVPEGEFVKFDIPQLLSTNGLSLNPSQSTPIQVPVAHCDFTLGTLYLNNPDSKTTVNSQVLMQGVVDLSNVPIIGKGLTAEVTGTNYVVVDASGVNLTGIKVTKTLPSDTKIKGFDVAGSVSIEYANSGTTKSFTFSGSVTLSSPAQDSGKFALQNVTGQLNLTVADDPKGLELTGLGIAVGGSFKIFDVSVSTPAAQPLSFTYDASQDQFKVGGDLNVDFNGNTLQVNLGSTSSTGIIFQQGVLTQFNGYVTADFSLFGVKVITNGLTFMYIRDTGTGQSQFELFGGLQLQIPSGSSPTLITANLGDQNNPGLIIQNGSLTQYSISGSRQTRRSPSSALA